MIVPILLLIIGLALLIFGADFLVRGVSALAETVGVPPLVIGLTVVAFGTSTPEMVVNIMSAARGQTGLAFGNIVGACTINVGFVLAMTAMIRPLTVEVSVVSREIPMMLLGVAAMVVLSEDSFLGSGSVDRLDRGDGIMLLMLFGVFLYYTISQALVRKGRDPFIKEVTEKIEVEAKKRDKPLGIDILHTLGGMVGVGVGGKLTVDAAVKVAAALGVPDVVIGVTLLSMGTTLPELTTGIIAARRGHGDIAIGNVVGSNIFNILFIGGMVATITPMPIPEGGQTDLIAMAVLNVLLLPIAVRGPLKIVRWEGALLMAGYLGYTLWRTITALAERGG